MTQFGPRKGMLLGTGVVAALLAGSALAWACTSLATLTAQPATAQPGDSVSLRGENFDPEGSKVDIQFNGFDGQTLATTSARANGTIATSVKVPKSVEPGQYVLLAVQEASEGGMAFGLPARTALVVPGPGGEVVPAPQSAVRPQAAASLSTADETSNTGWILLGVLGAVALTLFAIGLATFLGEVRRRDVSAVVRT